MEKNTNNYSAFILLIHLSVCTDFKFAIQILFSIHTSVEGLKGIPVIAANILDETRTKSTSVSHYNQESGDNQLQDECQGSQWDTDADGGWSQHQDMSNSHSHEHQLQQQQQSQTYEYEYGTQQPTQERSITPEIISNKSSKEIYKDLAKQWGITCKMSDACRCMECQGHYFDCEYDDNEHQKTDGGLGAGTPMFISEVMHGSACSIL